MEAQDSNTPTFLVGSIPVPILPGIQLPMRFAITEEAGEGDNFDTRVVTVSAGENVVAKILSVVKTWNREISILSAVGKVSDVIIRHPERLSVFTGSFDILNLAGSFPLTETGNRSAELTVSLVGSDGLMIAGSVAELLLAASPVQVLLGSIIPEAGADVGTSSRPIPRIPVGFSFENLPFHQVFRF